MSLYDSIGRAEKILNTYVRGVMPRRWRNKLLAARLMRYLAPASGYKMSYSVDDLAESTGFKPDRIAAELDRLSHLQILRVRDFRSGQRYELQHDAFVKVIGPWCDRVLAHGRARKLAFRMVSWALVVIALISIVPLVAALIYQYDIYQNAEGKLESLQALPPQERDAARDSAYSTLLWVVQDPKRFRAALENPRYKSLLPIDYGIDSAGLEPVRNVRRTEDLKLDSPIKITYSDLRSIDKRYFMRDWRLMSELMANTWGIPAPRRIDLQTPRRAFPFKRIQVELPGGPPIDIDLKPYDNSSVAVIDRPEQLAKPAREFLELCCPDLKGSKVENLPLGAVSWVVPQWSLPFWKASVYSASSNGSCATARSIASELLRRPELLLSADIVRLLLDRVDESYRDQFGVGGNYRSPTVAEARRARGDRLGQDLVEIVKLGFPLTGLPILLDMLADFPNESSKDAAKKVAGRLTNGNLELTEGWAGPRMVDEKGLTATAVPSRQLHGPWPGDAQPPAEQPPPDKTAEAVYREIEPWLARVEPPIRTGLTHETYLFLFSDRNPL